ncbi:MAG: ABC transporter permease [Lachnospiraceae bacterium]|nr:ABC transporter permease [Lachnospiraceae bacterium]
MKKQHSESDIPSAPFFRKETPCLTAQEAFLLAHKKHHTSIRLSRALLLAAFLALWEISVSFHWIDGFFFSSPSRIASCFLSMLQDGSLAANLGITLCETVFSFLLVILIGIFCATLLWYSHSASEILEPYLVVLNSLPKSALAPLFIVWLGTGMTTIIVAGISVALFGCIISLYTGFKQVDEEKIKLIYTLGGNKIDVYRKVILPGSIPTILSTMKVNIGLALVGVIIGEFLAARRGLGYLIIYGSQVFQLNLVITSILILCIIAMLLYQCIQWAEHWYRKRL